MAAFDRVFSGIPALDQAVDYIRMLYCTTSLVDQADESRKPTMLPCTQRILPESF